MSDQLLYGIKQALIMGALAVAGYVTVNQDQFFGNLDATAKAFVVGLLPLLVRVIEGQRDGVRAAEGKVQDADVAATIARHNVVGQSVAFANDPSLKVNQDLADQQRFNVYLGEE